MILKYTATFATEYLRILTLLLLIYSVDTTSAVLSIVLEEDPDLLVFATGRGAAAFKSFLGSL